MPAREPLQNLSRGLRLCARPADDGFVSFTHVPSFRRRSRLYALATATLFALCLAMALGAGPAAAFIEVPLGGNKVGIQPREVSRYVEGTVKWNGLGKNETESNAPAASFGNPSGNTVLHSANTYAIYWDPQDYYHGDWQGLIDGFLANTGASSGQFASVFAVDSQYTDVSNQPATSRSSFRGAYIDTNPYPPSNCVDPRPFALGAPLTQVCVTDAQLRAQLQTFVSQHSLPRGMSPIYYLLTPPGVAVCLDSGGATGHCSDFAGTIGEVETAESEKKEPTAYKSFRHSFCSYHGVVGEGSSAIIFGAIPWTAGGEGDNHLAAEDRVAAYDCQDGGFEPGKKVNGELQEKEAVKVKTALEEEEYEKKNAQEKREQREAEELGLQGPHQQEPNQRGAERTPDGGYDTGLADLVVNQIAVEQQNIVTNPLLNAWQDPSGGELTDECRNLFAPTPGGSVTANPLTRAGTLGNNALGGRPYYLNDAFNMAARRLPYPGVPCLSGIELVPSFTAPSPVKSEEIVGFDGMESNVTLDATASYPSGTTYATFTWDFGDGSPTVTGYGPGAPSLNSPGASPCEAPWLTPCAASTFHSYQYGGTYTVTLLVKDVGGNTASTTRTVTVEGPPPPGPAPAGAGGSTPGGSTSGGSTSGGSTSGGSKSGGSTAVQPKLLATQAILSTSLASTLRHGLVIRYSVNQQVAGRFEVLLASSLARRIGLHGPSATGLAKGTAPQTVIAKAVLVTTKGGRGTYRITFSKTTASRLRRLHKVTLMIRMVVHDASSPVATTVLNTVNLH
ncbi:MAG: hypothetical protein JWM66_1236 [Solirubrobacterales bacterium]|nr:hypothetical protein [Solirubrobacterales bacterium]